jgi:cytochrome b
MTDSTPIPSDPALDATVPVRVWDLPTRAFHWLLAAAVTGAIVTGEVGDPWMAWHFRLGEFAGALLAFRLVWGCVGGRWSRFASFLPSVARLRRHLRGVPAPLDHAGVGHNPLGALSVWAMLAFLAAQVATGLLADDEISITGPLSHLVGSDGSHRATSWHTVWGLYALFGLLALHVAAIGWYALGGKEPLVPAMWRGDKALPPGTPASRDSAGTRLVAAAIAAATLAAMFGAIAHWGA